MTFYSKQVLFFCFSYDEKKVKELGPNVAAAEWLIRNGAQAKFSKASTLTDYDKLLNEESYKSDQIIEIDATKSAINHVGFPYLGKHSISFRNR